MLVLALSLLGSTQVFAQVSIGTLDYRDYDIDDMGLSAPEGIAYDPAKNIFHTIQTDSEGPSRIISVAPYEAFIDAVTLDMAFTSPNVAFDRNTARLLIYDVATRQLIALSTEGNGALGDANTSVRYDLSGANAQAARGMVVDATTNTLYILDSGTREIIRVQANAAGNFEASSANRANVTRTQLNIANATSLQGLAYDGNAGHFYTLETARRVLYKLNTSGQTIASYDLAGMRLTNPQGLVIAPTADSTDDSNLMNLFITDSGLLPTENELGNSTIVLPEQFSSRMFLPLLTDDSIESGSGDNIEVEFASIEQKQGRLIELYLNPEPDVSVAATNAIPRVVNTTDTAANFDPPSTDSSGITYIPGTNRLLMSDSEINELPLYQGVNLWEIALNTTVLDTYNTLSFSDEPTDVAYAASRGPLGHAFLFISDDTDTRVVYVVDLGADGQYGTGDDVITSFSPANPTTSDPEGVTYDSWHDRIVVVDGINAEVYTVDPGLNGIFGDGDDTTTSFDVGGAPLSLNDPEGIEFDPVNGHLYIMGRNRIAETLLDGTLVRFIEIGAFTNGTAAGLAKAPPSNFDPTHPNDIYLYIVDRGIDAVSDGKLFEIGVEPMDTGHLAPVVNAGPDQNLASTVIAILDGTVTDDGLPNPPGAVTTIWSKLSGPGLVTFGNANAVDTTATFATSGVYVLRLFASDGSLASTDDVTILVNIGHNPPTVNAGPDQIVAINTGATLNGIVTDDGLPSPPALTQTWSKVYGPGNVTFGNATLANTTANFSETGVYVLRLTANDGQLTTVDEVTITVTLPTGYIEIDRRINANSDDAEERGGPDDGTVVTFGDLEMVVDQNANQTVGLRFNAIDIPPGAKVSNAYIQFALDEELGVPTSLVIQGHLTPNAPTFVTTGNPNFNISSRPRTIASVTWTPPPWTGPQNTADAAQRTNNIAAVIQEIIDQAQWASGNSLVIIISGTGERVARGHDDDPANAPLLHIEFDPEPSVNQAPTVNAGADQGIVLPADADLNGTVSDDGLPDGTLVTEWSQVSGPGTVIFGDANEVDTIASFSTPGNYLLRLSASDGALQASDDVAIAVSPGGGQLGLERRVAVRSDDAQEKLNNGKVDIKSKSLDVATNGNKVEAVGMRFNDINIPAGATILSAYIQFTVGKPSSGSARVLILGQAANDAATFTTARHNISSRPRTHAWVTWQPANWRIKGESGPNQRTPDLSAIIQEIINRPGWNSGNSLALILTGRGKRTAESWDGDHAGTPLLIITYSAPISIAGEEQTIMYMRLPMITTDAGDGDVP